MYRGIERRTSKTEARGISFRWGYNNGKRGKREGVSAARINKELLKGIAREK
jgi:hypothetical protein